MVAQSLELLLTTSTEKGSGGQQSCPQRPLCQNVFHGTEKRRTVSDLKRDKTSEGRMAGLAEQWGYRWVGGRNIFTW